MTIVQQVNIQCECHHRRGLLYVVRPWAWGRPCRRCRRMMERNVVVVPTSGGAATAVTVNNRRQVSPVVVATTTTRTQAVPVQQQVHAVAQVQTASEWQASQEAYPSALPPKYAP